MILMQKHRGFLCALSKRLLLIMKLVVLLITLNISALFADSFAQTITLRAKNISLVQAMRDIQKQSGHAFFLNGKELAQVKVNVDIQNLSLNQAIDKLLTGVNAVWVMEGPTIIIKPKRIKNTSIEIRTTTIMEDVQDLLTVKGHVTDAAGRPLVGATIRVVVRDDAGQLQTIKIAKSADGSGTFMVPDVPSYCSLVFSFLGYTPVEVKAKTNLGAVVLTPEDGKLKDVVVTGYTNIRKESFTGNAVTITKEQLLKINPNGIIQGLQHFDPSFRIKENSNWGSNPNNLPQFTIRGEGSIGMDKSLEAENLKSGQRTTLKNDPNLPIFILDGFEVSAQTIYDMDINRIENVTILKDAAATAMYGSRAANGVLVITTVPPKPGQMRISYNLSGGIEFPDLSDYNLTNAKEKLEAELLSGVYNMQNPTDQLKYNDIENRIARGIDTDWLAQPLRNAFNHKHSLVVEGGAESIRYAINVNHDENNGAMKGSYRDRSGAGLTVDYRSKKLDLKNQVTFNSVRMSESPYGTFSTYAKQQPYEAIYEEDGSIKHYLETGLGSNNINPLWRTTLDSYAGKGHINELQNNLSANWYIMDGLQFRGQFSVTKTDNKQGTYKDPREFDSYVAQDERGSLTEDLGNGYNWNTNMLLHYNKMVNKHFINATIGVNARETYEEGYNMQYLGFSLGNLQGPVYAAKQKEKTGYSSAKTRLFGTLASVNYSFNNIYLVDASLRFDGSSQFGTDKKIAPFWAFGAGLNIHNYSFMQNYPYVSTLKVRGTYGATGKVNFPAYTAITSYKIDDRAWYYTGPAASIIYLGNPALKWETTKTLDAGFELGLLNNRYYITATYYDKATYDLIDQVSIAQASGFATYRANSGTIVNNGIELNVRATAYQSQDWVVALYGNLAANKNRIKELGAASHAYNEALNREYDSEFNSYPELKQKPATRYYEGASTTAIYAVQSAGIDPANGKERFIKRDGTSTYTWAAIDQVVVGDTNPSAQGAFGINASYKGFYVNTSLLYQWGAQTYNSTLLDKVENADIRNSNVDRRVLTERWRRPGDLAPFYGLNFGSNRVTRPTDRFVQNYSYLSLSSISFGYDFRKPTLERLKLSNLGFRANLNEVARWSTVKEERGTSYPYAKNVTFTLTVGI